MTCWLNIDRTSAKHPIYVKGIGAVWRNVIKFNDVVELFDPVNMKIYRIICIKDNFESVSRVVKMSVDKWPDWAI